MSSQARVVTTGVIGTVLEWAEYCFYGYLAVHIGQYFFPTVDPRTQVLAAFAVFAAGFLARPIGGVIFGHMGDRIGRKKALTIAMLLMGIATLGIGCLPTYDQVGVTAPVLLLCCRLLQGLAVSGEFNGAAIFLIEHDDTRQPYLAGSWVGAAASGGMLLGAGIVAIITLPTMPTWSWRIPFWLGSISCVAGFYLRRNIDETPEFLALKKAQKIQRLPLVTCFKESKTAMLITGSLAAFIGIYVYVCNLYFTSYLIQQSGFSTHTATLVAAFGQALVCILIPLVATVADQIGGRLLILLGLIGATLFAPIIFILGGMHSIMMALIAQSLYAIFDAIICAPVFKFLYDLFPTQTRYSGTTFAWSVSVALFGGTAPMAAQYLVGHQQITLGPAILVSISAIFSFLVVLFKSQPERMAFLNLGPENTC